MTEAFVPENPVAKSAAASVIIKCITSDLDVIEAILNEYIGSKEGEDKAYDDLERVAEKINEIRMGVEMNFRSRVVNDADCIAYYTKKFESEDE